MSGGEYPEFIPPDCLVVRTFLDEATKSGADIIGLKSSNVLLRRKDPNVLATAPCPETSLASQGWARHCSMVNLFFGFMTSILSIKSTYNESVNLYITREGLSCFLPAGPLTLSPSGDE